MSEIIKSTENIQSSVPDRNPSGTMPLMTGIRCRRWTNEEEKYIRNNRDKMSITEIAGNLGRSSTSVQRKEIDLRDNKEFEKSTLNFFSKAGLGNAYPSFQNYSLADKEAVKFLLSLPDGRKYLPYQWVEIPEIWPFISFTEEADRDRSIFNLINTADSNSKQWKSDRWISVSKVLNFLQLSLLSGLNFLYQYDFIYIFPVYDLSQYQITLSRQKVSTPRAIRRLAEETFMAESQFTALKNAFSRNINTCKTTLLTVEHDKTTTEKVLMMHKEMKTIGFISFSLQIPVNDVISIYCQNGIPIK